MKVSIITPTYNDGISIVKTLDSLRLQNYTDWEHIIVDDGSTDDTKQKIEEYIQKYNLKDKVKYIFQENADQLNAIINALQNISGEYVFTLHSDDLLPNETFLQKAVKYMDENQEYDAITGNLIIIDENDNITNEWKAIEYKKEEQKAAMLILNNGANIYGDVYFLRKKIYMEIVKQNYLIWNTPIWIDFQKDKIKLLNIKTLDVPFLKYRIHSNNYANNEIGKFSLLNGEIRTLSNLMYYFEIKNYICQKIIFDILRAPLIRKLKLYNYQNILYNKKETKNKYKIIKKAIKKQYGDKYKENIFFDSLVDFYKNIKSGRKIELPNDIYKIYYGKDIRNFAKKIFENNLEPEYIFFLQEMKKGFDKIIVKNEKEKQQAIDISRFLCIYPYVTIEVKENI